MCVDDNLKKPLPEVVETPNIPMQRHNYFFLFYFFISFDDYFRKKRKNDAKLKKK